MTATDEIRSLLDERGVEYRFNDAIKVFEWHYDGTDGEGFAHATEVNGGINIIACSLTPEQVIAATLGPEMCHLNRVSGFPSMFDARRCDNCWNVAVYDSKHEPKVCPYCGRRVVDE